MNEFLLITINAFFTGMGVAGGTAIYTWFKSRKNKIKELNEHIIQVINKGE